MTPTCWGVFTRYLKGYCAEWGLRIPRRKPTIKAHNIMTSQKLPTLQECLDAPAYSAVTCSPCSIESPQTQKLYITPPPQKPKKEDIRADCLGYLAKVKGIPASAKNLMTWLSNRRRWRKDGHIRISFAVTARHFNMSERQIIRLYKCLEKHNCIRIVQRGGLRGDKREANLYALGSFFDARPPKESEHIPMTKMSEVRDVIPMTKMSDDLCQECHSLPIVSPYKNTHRKSECVHIDKETSSPDRSLFDLENWLYRGKEKFPDWDERDLMGSYESALRNGVNGTWELYQDKCYARRFNACPDSPRSSPAPRPAVKSSCESPRQEPAKLSELNVLIGEIVYAKKVNESLEVIKSCNPLAFEEAERTANSELLDQGWFFCKEERKWVLMFPEPTESL